MSNLNATVGCFLAILLFGPVSGSWAQDFNPVAKTTPPDAPESLPTTSNTQHPIDVPPSASTAAAAPGSERADMNPGRLSAADRLFLHNALQGGMLEVALGKSAEKNGQSARVRHLGVHTAADHAQLDQDLLALAQSKGVLVSTKCDVATQEKIDRVTSASDFDAAYVHLLLRAHRQDIAAFENAASTADDADLRALAARALPTLRHHLSMAETAESHLP